MYLSALEQFEIVPFLAFGSQTLSLPNSVISFIFCILFLFIALNICCCVIASCTYAYLFWKFKSKTYNDKYRPTHTFTTGVRYVDYPPEHGKRVKRIFIPVEITDQMSSDLTINFISKYYHSHPWVTESRFHFLYLGVFYFADKAYISNVNDLASYIRKENVDFTFVYPKNSKRKDIDAFLKKSLDTFIKKNKSDPFHISFVVLTLIDDTSTF
jgi:nitrogen fixation-related uncharacterized protein